ncbi:MAG TPA: PAS domain S-box protein [Terriglobales bacterium]|jgi:PAS domain S-box-containing protein|nr:PAS domain S-box protein [Terriglobales bacterium]
MGDKITQPAKVSELLRAKLLQKALHNGTPTFSRPDDPAVAASAPPTPPLASEDIEVQRAYLEQLVECTPEAISILDHYQVLRINSEFSRMFGFQPEEALGRRIDSLIVPPDRGSETLWIGEMLAKGQKVMLESKRRHKDGTLVDVFISAAPVLIGGNRVASYVLYRDISEQKRAETLSSALYRIAEKTSSAVDLQQFFAAIHNIVGELMYARNFYIALYDPLTQLLSFPYFVDEEDATPVPKKLGRGLTEYVMRTGDPLLCTPEVFDALLAQGEVELIGAPSVDWLGVPLKAANNTFGALVVQSYRDSVRYRDKDKEILTFVSQQLASAIEYKEHEEALRRSESRYRSLVQSAVYGIYRSSVDGKFLDVNPALIAMLGYDSPEEVLGLDPRTHVFLDPDEQSRLMKEFERSGRLDDLEVRWKRKDGNAITVRLSGRAVSTPEEPDQVLEIIAQDVTERRVLEDQFRQAQKMEAVGRLAGGVAHDFNNLLMVISGYTEVLLERTQRGNPVYAKIEAIQQAADRATTLTRQLLAFSRKQLLELKVVDVNAIVADIERLLRPLIGESIELITRLAPDLGRTRADAGQIEQVIMNLVVNSKDAMPDGGKITIQTGNVSLDDDLRREYSYIQPGPYVMLSVSDDGQGMDKETQARIFEPFFTTKEKGKGTGLGLSTVYGIVKQSGGYVFVNSELGRGTTFRIYLPRVEDAAEPLGKVHAAQAASGGSETVLLVEDEESVRQLVRETLEAKGYKVLEADQGEAALRVASAHPGTIDMLITDVVMPGMSGRELARQLSTSRPQTKVLYLSGYTEDAILHQGALDPGTAFLQKPFTLQALSRKVREVLNDGLR